MAQQQFLVLVVAICSLVQADLDFDPVISDCGTGINEIFDLSQLTIEDNVFQGNITLNIDISLLSLLQVTVGWNETRNGQLESRTPPRLEPLVCATSELSPVTDELIKPGPESFLVEKVLGESGSPACLTPIEAGTIDVTGVPINQARFKGMTEDSEFVIELVFSAMEGLETYSSCARMEAVVAPDTP